MTAAIQQRIPAPAARQRHQVVVPARRLDDLDVGFGEHGIGGCAFAVNLHLGWSRHDCLAACLASGAHASPRSGEIPPLVSGWSTTLARTCTPSARSRRPACRGRGCRRHHRAWPGGRWARPWRDRHSCPLVPVVNAVTPVPVLAAGGIADACDRSSPAHVLRSCLPMIARSRCPPPRLGHVMRGGAFFDPQQVLGPGDGVALRSTW